MKVVCRGWREKNVSCSVSLFLPSLSTRDCCGENMIPSTSSSPANIRYDFSLLTSFSCGDCWLEECDNNDVIGSCLPVVQEGIQMVAGR